MAEKNKGDKRKPVCPVCKNVRTENVMVGGRASGIRQCPECKTFYKVVLEKI